MNSYKVNNYSNSFSSAMHPLLESTTTERLEQNSDKFDQTDYSIDNSKKGEFEQILGPSPNLQTNCIVVDKETKKARITHHHHHHSHSHGHRNHDLNDSKNNLENQFKQNTQVSPSLKSNNNKIIHSNHKNSTQLANSKLVKNVELNLKDVFKVNYKFI